MARDSELPTATSDLTNDSGFITGISNNVTDNAGAYKTYRLDDCTTATGMATGDLCFEY